ncbi:MAG: hypothetical protein EBQ99_07070 [Planctomycetes bacterium]|nr:hypothetical protein [Planctomycetota bacterium]
MGQAALAFRNLLIKAAVFVAMAALLAWAVGGTLFGSHRVNFPAVDWGGREWAAQVIGNGRQPDRVRWCLVSRAGEGPWQVHPSSDGGPWRDMIGPVADANGLRLAVATEQGGGKSWQLLTFSTADAAPAITPLAQEPADRRLPTH